MYCNSLRLGDSASIELYYPCGWATKIGLAAADACHGHTVRYMAMSWSAQYQSENCSFRPSLKIVYDACPCTYIRLMTDLFEVYPGFADSPLSCVAMISHPMILPPQALNPAPVRLLQGMRAYRNLDNSTSSIGMMKIQRAHKTKTGTQSLPQHSNIQCLSGVSKSESSDEKHVSRHGHVESR